ncbi:methyltransferase CmcJ [Lindgomyces ingoldianus]|uniref:Methyltransferase CmcJ n=1 Tax=Lindgomyces ingoldianus TaxID=673940 RepID=A0ACB6QR57_9PLEO|nr:methyltransferase CmcJ [Lindgomyces ingoldianus]KAF2469391.1 methyltransferase CmcJ [Lindgomyces ingoldianus]
MPHSEPASIQFLKWSPLYDKEKPYQVFLDKDLDTEEDQQNTNLAWEEKFVTVQDFRGCDEYSNLDAHGFTSRTLPGFEHLETRDDIETGYIPAVEEMLKREIEDVGTIFVFDWRGSIADREEIRDSRSEYPSGLVNFGDQTESLLPSNFAHVDMAPISIVHRIQKSFPKDAERIFEQRIRAINVWKPLDYPVDQWSLALCSGTTVPSSTLVETDSVRRENITTLYYATYTPDQTWKFLHRQTPKEALIFKHFDSRTDVKASFAMHSSIKHKNVSPNAQPRRSIEVRTLVFDECFDLPAGSR